MRIAAMGCLVFLLPLLSQQKQAPPPKKEIREVRATGCVLLGAEPKCILVKTLDGSTVYNIFSQTQQPYAGTVITFEGKEHDGVTTCMQGIPVDVVSWEATGEKCSK